MAKIEMLVFDMDGTLIRNRYSNFNSSWDAVGIAAGLEREFEENKRRFYSDFEQWNNWAQSDARLLRNKNFDTVRQETMKILSYAPGLKEMMAMTRGKFRHGILSNGVGFVAEQIIRELGMDFYLADRLKVIDGLFTGEVIEGMPDRDKKKGLDLVCQNHLVKPENICYVGDHINDLGVFKIVALPVYINNGIDHPDLELVRTEVKHQITDFRELVKIVESYNLKAS